MIQLIENSGLSYGFNGDQNYCMSNTMNIFIQGVDSEALMISTKEYCAISNGSACNSNSYKPSYVLNAMGISEERIRNSIRISWGPEILVEAIEDSFGNFLEIAKGLVW